MVLETPRSPWTTKTMDHKDKNFDREEGNGTINETGAMSWLITEVGSWVQGGLLYYSVHFYVFELFHKEKLSWRDWILGL